MGEKREERSGTRDSKRMWPALWRVVRYGAGFPIEAMKRMRLAGFVRSGIVVLGVLGGWCCWMLDMVKVG